MRFLAALASVSFLVAGCTSAGTAAIPTPAGTTAPEPAVTPQLPSYENPTPTASPQPVVQPPSPSPSPALPATTPGPPEYAVLLDLFAGGSSYNLALAGADARVVATAHAAKRSDIADAAELPYVSVSKSRVYFLDGDRDVRYLKADGTTGPVTTIPGSARVHAAFAVTPDDSRIAVTLLDYSVSPVALTLYVEDLGGAHHAVIFTSTTKYLWPVAWHSGLLVVAYMGPGAQPFKSNGYYYTNRDLTRYPYGPNAYGGVNFHVIDPVTAIRQVIMSGGGASGLLSKAGTAVVQGSGVDWVGGHLFGNTSAHYGSFSASGSISPNGQMIAACCPQPASSGSLVIWFPGDQWRVAPVTVTSIDWVGWLDDSHVVTGFYQAAEGTPSAVDLNSGAVKTIDAHGIVVAIFPSNLEG
ncbi:MAG: hypothetical protein NVS1B3_14670 [Candidatus Dormibacteraceae bacterium]